MGAPTGSFEVEMRTCARAPPEPEIVTVAGRPAERCLTSDHAAGSGFHECAAACSGVSLGGWFDSATHRGSISPILMDSPRAVRRMAGAPSGNAISSSQAVAGADGSLLTEV